MTDVTLRNNGKDTIEVAIESGGGGSIPDPLALGAAEFTNYVAVGATPAAIGAVRLEDEGYVVAAGDYRLIGLDSGDGWIEIDPDSYGVHFGTDQRTVNPHTEIYSGITNYSAPATEGSPAKNPSPMAIQGQYYGGGSNHLTKLTWGLTMDPGEAGSWFSLFGHANAGIIMWFDAGENEGYVSPSNPGQSLGHSDPTYQWGNIYANLPTDPAGLAAGAFWRDAAASNVVKVVPPA